jgi:hypothetical protein
MKTKKPKAHRPSPGAFIKSLPLSVEPEAVISQGRREGFEITRQQVGVVRHHMRKRAVMNLPKKAKVPPSTLPKLESPPGFTDLQKRLDRLSQSRPFFTPFAGGLATAFSLSGDHEVQFLQAAANIGLDRACALIEEARRRIVGTK